MYINVNPRYLRGSQVKLPADQEDWQKRPAYIKENNAGVYICENRYALDYNMIDPGL